MRKYRVYTLDGAGNITRGIWVDAETDEEAVARVRQMKLATKCEVWERDRRIAKVGAYSQ